MDRFTADVLTWLCLDQEAGTNQLQTGVHGALSEGGGLRVQVRWSIQFKKISLSNEKISTVIDNHCTYGIFATKC